MHFSPILRQELCLLLHYLHRKEQNGTNSFPQVNVYVHVDEEYKSVIFWHFYSFYLRFKFRWEFQWFIDSASYDERCVLRLKNENVTNQIEKRQIINDLYFPRHFKTVEKTFANFVSQLSARWWPDCPSVKL